MKDLLRDWISHRTKTIIRRYADDEAFLADRPYLVTEIDGNVLLNVGIQALWYYGASVGSAPAAAYTNAAANIGVGDSSTAAAATQTGLQAATNKTYKPMQATYPSIASQTVSWQSQFGGSDANYAWNEFCVDNGNHAQSLNRVVSSQGAKTSGQTWTVTVQITLS